MPDLQFDEEKHLYSVEGKRLISVTQALSLVDDRIFRDKYYLERGRIVHLITELYDKNELDESSVDPEVEGYFTAYKRFLLETGFVVRLIEHRMADLKWQFAGTLDREGAMQNYGAIVDLKTGSPSRVDHLQGSAYHHLYGSPAHKVFDLYLHEDGTYKLVEVPKPRILFPTFCAVLTAYRFKEGI